MGGARKYAAATIIGCTVAHFPSLLPETLPEISVEDTLRRLPAIHKAMKLLDDRKNNCNTHLKKQIRSLFTEENFAPLVTRNTLGFPIMNQDNDILNSPLIAHIVKEMKKNRSVTLSSNGSTITLHDKDASDICFTYFEELEKYLIKVQKESDALEVQVQKQVLGLEGVTQ